MKPKEMLVSLGACSEAVEWAQPFKSANAAWKDCKRGDWMLWYCSKWAGEIGSPERRKLVGVAAACARLALPIWQKRHPWDDRVEKCLIACEGYAQGTVSDSELRLGRADAAAAAYAAAAAAAYAAAADAAYAAAAADDARKRVLAQCADIVRTHYPSPPAK